MEQIHYVIYKITNMLNGMIYIGQHTTTNINDAYMGSGKYITRAIKKYGVENFKKEILFECSSQEELNAKEREIVNEKFVKRTDTYNLVMGGIQGLSHKQAVMFGKMGAQSLQRTLKDPLKRKTFEEKLRDCAKRAWKEHPEKFKKFRCDWSGRHHTDETKTKMREKGKLRMGEKNSMFGRIWIHNDLVQRNITIDKKDLHYYLEQCWETGRVVDWNKYFEQKKKKYKQASIRLNRQRFKEAGINNPKVDFDIEQKIDYYKKILPIFLHNRWRKFVELSGYKYSSQNFYFQMNVYLRLDRPKLKEMKRNALLDSKDNV